MRTPLQRPYSVSGTPLATCAFQIRAPSTCRPMLCASTSGNSASMSSSGCTLPPAKLWVFSIEIALVATKNGDTSGANIASMAGRSMPPRSPVQVRMVTPKNAPCAPSSARAMWADDSQSTSCPGATRERTASRLAIEPVGVKRAASLPNSPATCSSSATDGRVLAVHVVADLGAGHRRPHPVGRLGHGVAAQVDESHGPDAMSH